MLFRHSGSQKGSQSPGRRPLYERQGVTDHLLVPGSHQDEHVGTSRKSDTNLASPAAARTGVPTAHRRRTLEPNSALDERIVMRSFAWLLVP
jgi:hypothetical protein